MFSQRPLTDWQYSEDIRCVHAHSHYNDNTVRRSGVYTQASHCNDNISRVSDQNGASLLSVLSTLLSVLSRKTDLKV